MAAPSTQPSTRINSTLISSLFQSRQLWLTANFQKSSVSPSTLAHPSAPHQSNITGPESIGTNRDSPNHQIKTTYLGEADVTIGPHIFSGTKFWSVDLSTASSKMIEDSSVRISRNDESGIKKEEIIFQFRENKETPFIWPEISLFELNDAQKNTPFYNVDSGAGIKDTQENEHDLIVYCFLPGPPPSSTASSITQSTLDSTSSLNDAGTSHSPRRSKDRRNEDGEVVLIYLNGVGQNLFYALQRVLKQLSWVYDCLADKISAESTSSLPTTPPPSDILPIYNVSPKPRIRIRAILSEIGETFSSGIVAFPAPDRAAAMKVSSQISGTHHNVVVTKSGKKRSAKRREEKQSKKPKSHSLSTSMNSSTSTMQSLPPIPEQVQRSQEPDSSSGCPSRSVSNSPSLSNSLSQSYPDGFIGIEAKAGGKKVKGQVGKGGKSRGKGKGKKKWKDGRSCTYCGVNITPIWRSGPLGTGIVSLFCCSAIVHFLWKLGVKPI